MTRAELFRAFPRPWRLDSGEIGAVLCADGGEALTVDVLNFRPDKDAQALAALIVELVNEAGE